MQLYRSLKSASDWSNIVPADTAGIINSYYELHNSDRSWDIGAFSSTNDTANQFDLGWGVYDFVTHVVSGDSLYFIKLSNGNFKKLWIESLTSGIYYFRWADLDGSNEVTASLNKSLFTGKFFAYYSIQNNVSLDREPVYNSWDLLFTQYLSLTPYIYKVAGVLSNDSVFCAKAYPVDVNNVNPAGYTFSSEINTIGYDWKTFDFGNNVWTIEDSLVYFVHDRSNALWKVIFTGFGGSANGVYNFSKELLGTTGLGESQINPILNLYPNPASGEVFITIVKNGGSSKISIINALGQSIRSEEVNQDEIFTSYRISLQGMEKGIYFLTVSQNGLTSSRPFIVQ